jgi:glycosyltransferase involved in cell wall biosynthesis
LVLTVNDLLYIRHPEWLPTDRARWYWGDWIAFTARRASAVIAPSESTKRDLVDLAKISPERVYVTPYAVDQHFLKTPTQAEVLAYQARQGLASPYILYVGIIDRRKDLGGLVRAYAQARSRLKDHRLVIAGHVIRGGTALVEEIQAAGVGKDVLLPGYVSDSELPLLYAGASLFVYPSCWEGFGLPPLEAMAQGVPVITYRNSSLPEVVGDAAVLIDPPFPVEALADAMVRVIQDEALGADLRARGYRRISELSWDRTAEQTMAVYERCLNGGAV